MRQRELGKLAFRLSREWRFFETEKGKIGGIVIADGIRAYWSSCLLAWFTRRRVYIVVECWQFLSFMTLYEVKKKCESYALRFYSANLLILFKNESLIINKYLILWLYSIGQIFHSYWWDDENRLKCKSPYTQFVWRY